MKRSRRRRLVVVVGVLLVALVIVGCAFLPDFPRIYKSGKYDPVEQRDEAIPRAKANRPIAEQQTESHTCGWHATRSLYTAYGLTPDDFRLRFRLGTDTPAMRSDKDSTGTLHPDLYRVLAQDGFFAKPVDLDDATAERAIADHLANDQLALAVVYRSTYHWVVLARAPGGEWVVVDSLKPGAASPIEPGVFLNDALSITLVRPAEPGERVDTADAHAAGLAEMARLYQRK